MEILLACLAGVLALGLAVALLRVASLRREVVRARASAGPPVPAEEAAEARRRAGLTHLPAMVVLVGSDLRVSGASAEAVERFPFLRPGILLLDAFAEHELAARAQAALADLQPQRFDLRLFEGGRQVFRVDIAPYEAAGDREALLLLADTSDAAAYQELRSQFVANVSHELRTPLTGLRALLESLEDGEMDAETRLRFAQRARRESERLEALIADTLFLSELEATQGLPSDARSDLSEAARDAAEGLLGEAGEHGVRLEVDAPGPVWTALTERMAFTVATNLIENAVKYAGAGAGARVTVQTEGDQVILEVVDDGDGISARHLPHIFERFYRADPSRSKRLGGTGLGLSIVKHIAERSGGFAEASSREGFGTTVRVCLPVAPAPGPDDPFGRDDGGADAAPARVTRN